MRKALLGTKYFIGFVLCATICFCWGKQPKREKLYYFSSTFLSTNQSHTTQRRNGIQMSEQPACLCDACSDFSLKYVENNNNLSFKNSHKSKRIS